jgi:hypothetical protein
MNGERSGTHWHSRTSRYDVRTPSALPHIVRHSFGYCGDGSGVWNAIKRWSLHWFRDRRWRWQSHHAAGMMATPESGYDH